MGSRKEFSVTWRSWSGIASEAWSFSTRLLGREKYKGLSRTSWLWKLDSRQICTHSCPDSFITKSVNTSSTPLSLLSASLWLLRKRVTYFYALLPYNKSKNHWYGTSRYLISVMWRRTSFLFPRSDLRLYAAHIFRWSREESHWSNYNKNFSLPRNWICKNKISRRRVPLIKL